MSPRRGCWLHIWNYMSNLQDEGNLLGGDYSLGNSWWRLNHLPFWWKMVFVVVGSIETYFEGEDDFWQLVLISKSETLSARICLVSFFDQIGSHLRCLDAFLGELFKGKPPVVWKSPLLGIWYSELQQQELSSCFSISYSIYYYSEAAVTQRGSMDSENEDALLNLTSEIDSATHALRSMHERLTEMRCSQMTITQIRSELALQGKKLSGTWFAA